MPQNDPAVLVVSGTRVADPTIGVRPLCTKLQEQQPKLGAGRKELREALRVLEWEDNGEAGAAKALAHAANGCARPGSAGQEGLWFSETAGALAGAPLHQAPYASTELWFSSYTPCSSMILPSELPQQPLPQLHDPAVTATTTAPAATVATAVITPTTFAIPAAPLAAVAPSTALALAAMSPSTIVLIAVSSSSIIDADVGSTTVTAAVIPTARNAAVTFVPTVSSMLRGATHALPKAANRKGKPATTNSRPIPGGYLQGTPRVHSEDAEQRRVAAATEERKARERADTAASERMIEEESKPKAGQEKKKQGKVKKDKPLTFDGGAEPTPSSKAVPVMSQDDSHPTSNDGGSETSPAEQLTAEVQTQHAKQAGDTYQELQAEGVRYVSQKDWCNAAKVYRKALVVRPDKGDAYLALGGVLFDSAHHVEAALRFLEATERTPEGSDIWAAATSAAFEALRRTESNEVRKPEWWNDGGLMALSERVVKAAPNLEVANRMRATVLSGLCGGAWEVGPRSATELRLAALHYERCAALCSAPAWQLKLAGFKDWCYSQADAM